MSIGTRIADARRLKGWSQGRLATAINAAQTTISSWERGRTEPTRDDVTRIARAMGVPTLESDSTVAVHSIVPIVGYVGAAAEYFGIDDHERGASLEEIEAPPGVPDGAVAVVVRGDSAYPAYSEGNVLIFWNKMLDPSPVVGEKCFVRLLDGRTLVKILERGSDASHWTLVSINTSTQPIRDVEIDWAAPIELALRRRNWKQ